MACPFMSVNGMEYHRMSLLVQPYTRFQHAVLYGLTLIWLVLLLHFYHWWFDPDHRVSLALFTLNTLPVLWFTLLPAYFLYFMLRARVPNPQLPLPADWRVAMIVTKVPAEPLTVIQETLKGMLRQHYPADIWLADEDPAPDTLAWCHAHHVRICSRKDINDYHRPHWPRKARCKEGNLAHFYDKFGYEHYDFVIQMDADHIPQRDYLENMLRPFVDPRIGYVTAPSICDLNADQSWSAKSRLYAEGHLHGIQQAGYTHGFAPLCFGSHYGIRTQALREIGGLGPELAEDHSTTLMMNAAGWRGVHAIQAHARGHGPRSFVDFAVQEFQWARSITTILLKHTPTYWPRLPWRLKLQFAFSQLWYPLSSLFMLSLILLPVIAILSHTPLVKVVFLDFLWRISLLIAPLWLIDLCLTRCGLTRPVTAKILSWEALCYLPLRWPWTLAGCVIAVWDRWRDQSAKIHITPKPGSPSATPSTLLFALPYLLCSLLSIGAMATLSYPNSAAAYVLFSVINALIYALLAAAVLLNSPAPDIVPADTPPCPEAQ